MRERERERERLRERERERERGRGRRSQQFEGTFFGHVSSVITRVVLGGRRKNKRATA